MTISLWCLVIATFLPLLCAGWASALRIKQFGAADNKMPRAQQARQEGAGARVYAAQSNGWEALAMFTPAVLIAHAVHPDAAQASTAAIIFIAARIVHPFVYVANLDKLRTAAFGVGAACCIWLFVIAAQ